MTSVPGLPLASLLLPADVLDGHLGEARCAVVRQAGFHRHDVWTVERRHDAEGAERLLLEFIGPGDLFVGASQLLQLADLLVELLGSGSGVVELGGGTVELVEAGHAVRTSGTEGSDA